MVCARRCWKEKAGVASPDRNAARLTPSSSRTERTGDLASRSDVQEPTSTQSIVAWFGTLGNMNEAEHPSRMHPSTAVREKESARDLETRERTCALIGRLNCSVFAC